MAWRDRFGFPSLDNLNCCRKKPIHICPLPRPIDCTDTTDGKPFVDPESESNILIVRHINPKIEINGSLHHTAKYELMNRTDKPSLVVRRGQSFLIELILNRAYNETDGISFIFTVDDEEKPSHGAGSLVGVALSAKFHSNRTWNGVISKIEQNSIAVEITPAADCIVGCWRMDVDTKSREQQAYSYTWCIPIYILFNPWCREDDVYMDAPEWREEAVLEESGLMWRGTANRMRSCVWQYGQFEKDVLQCALYLIRHVGRVIGRTRNDPVETARALVSSVNSFEDDGALVGNWTNNFEDGTAPSKWLGSHEILEKFYAKKKPVKYAQCWVFSGVVTTVCRVVGIPCRPVTNYSSAHDADGSITLDYVMTDTGEMIADMNRDSIWNFHVWNEVWMSRPDLGDDYNGWQAIDATPQARREVGKFKCGPASLVAIKRGEIKRPYDCCFVYAEVNADIVYWRYDGPTQPLKLISSHTDTIGKQISTKSPGEFQRLDITDSYKHPEKSDEERESILAALREAESMFSRYYLNEEFNDVYFNFQLNDDVVIGEPFTVTLMIENKSFEDDYDVHIILRAEVVNYMGKVGKEIKKEEVHVKSIQGSKQEVEVVITYDEYFQHLLDQAAFNISCLAKIEQLDYEYFAQDDFRVRKPNVQIVIDDSPIEDVECYGTAYIINPLPIPLHKCVFKLQGPRLSKTIKIADSIAAGGRATVEFSFVPRKIGMYTIAAKFNSKELNDCDGYENIYVSTNDTSNSND